MTTTHAELNRYFEMINPRVPISVSQSIRWLRKPSSFAVRLVVALLLILGLIFSFLPVLGLWMLPLGLLFIAQDVPLLQKPLVGALGWVEAKWEWLKVKWRNRKRSVASGPKLAAIACAPAQASVEGWLWLRCHHSSHHSCFYKTRERRKCFSSSLATSVP
jgi:hypothetical protein